MQEHDNHTVFLLPITAETAIIVVTESSARLGWLRVATQRAGQVIACLLSEGS